MPWIYVWTSEIKNIYVWTTPVKEVYVGTTKVRPKIINFATQWPCPDGFHIPLSSEWNNVFTIWRTLWAWGYNPWNDLVWSLKIPKSWNRDSYSWSIVSQWNYWYYRASDAYNSGYWYFFSPSSTSPVSYAWQASWFQIRPFKNEAIQPDSSWVKIVGNLSAWLFWNDTLWLITMSSDGTNWITISNKNLWATTVYDYGDALSEANCGKYYQWGNNYWFPFTWSVTTSSTQVDASTYWPWNYYSSSTFIKNGAGWQASNNLNLRWWVDGNVPV